MKFLTFSRHFLAAFTLIAVAAVVILAALYSDRGDISSATLFLAGTGLFAAGIFVLTLAPGEGVDPAIAALLAAPSSLIISRLCADLSVQGNARIFPAKDGLLQFIPAAPGSSLPKISEDFSFVTDESGPGIVTPPSGAALLEYLEKEHALVLPADEETLLDAIREVYSEVIDLAESADARRAGNHFLITLKSFRLYHGCSIVHSHSPKCCAMAPCPACSLAACMLAKGLGREVTIEGMTINAKDRGLTLSLSVAPS